MERTLFFELLALSWMGTVLGVLLMALRPLTRKLFSWKWHYYLWAVVFLRLLLPVHLDGSFLPLPRLWSPVGIWEEQLQEETVAAGETQETAGAGLQAAEDRMEGNETAGSGMPEAGAAQAAVQNTPAKAEAQDMPSEAGAQYPGGAGAQDTSAAPVSFIQGACVVWLFGTLLSLLLKGNDYRNFVRYVKADCIPVEDDRILRQAEAVSEELHIRRWVGIYVSPLVASPALIGIFSPFIVLPKGDLRPEESALILRHELTHLKRKDIWYKWLFQLAACVHWFNPFVYWFGRQLDRDCELSCDESVVGALTAEQRRNYGNILLDTAERHLKFRRSVLSTTLLEGKKDLKQRLTWIAAYRKRGTLAACLSAAVFVCVTALAACTSPEASQESRAGIEALETSGSAPSKSAESAGSAPSEESEASEGLAVEDAGEEGGFLQKFLGIFARNSWMDSVLNDPFQVSAGDDAYSVYDDDGMIAGKDTGDSQWRAYFYSQGDGRIEAAAFAFWGSDSILIAQAEEPVTITAEVSWEELEGDFKIVQVSPGGNVETLKEEGSEASVPITLETGRNVVKMVGREARLKQLNVTFKGLEQQGISAVYDSEEEEDYARLPERIESGEAHKQEFFDALPALDEDDALQIFRMLLERKEDLTDGELSDVFIFQDEKKVGDVLVDAIQNSGYPHPMQGTIMYLLPWLDDGTAAELVEELTQEEYSFNLLEELLYSVDEDAAERCLDHYYAVGNRLTDRQYEKVEPYLNTRMERMLDQWKEE